MTAWNDLLAGALPAPLPPISRPAEVVTAPPTDPRLIAPRTRTELQAWCRQWLGVSLPSASVCPCHSTPLDYLAYVFFEEGDADPLVWACRGGGKTLLGAVATLLDMLFKPGVEIRILGGSQAQSERMYEHLVRLVESHFRDQMIRSGRQGRITKSGFTLANGSRVELLAQSESSVRGARVQKVRCDEVDMFEPKVWNAVQLTTLSKRMGDGRKIRGSIEAFSTLNGPRGVMEMLLQDKTRKVFSWCVWDVIEKCNESCTGCILAPDCQGKARSGTGYMSVADVRVMRGRVDDVTWRYEVLCDARAGSRIPFALHVLRY